MRSGGVVLCGGRSTRMGTPKAWLPVGHEVMLQRVVRLLASVVDPVVVVAAAHQDLPPLPPEVEVAYDPEPDLGPLAGLGTGLRAMEGTVEAAFATGCDTPLLNPAVVSRIVQLLGDAAIAIPHVEGRLYPLAAVYRLTGLDEIDRRLSIPLLRLAALTESLPTRHVSPQDLADLDPDLLTLRNLNTPEEYRSAVELLAGGGGD